ncbi:hypothetical protein [Streptosporangium sp. V21-05]|uniref:hypothetical protein n=1 Tax=Streptosporangium sp. V21-05 TaxID=3446115 RepID=UPI003F5351BA
MNNLNAPVLDRTTASGCGCFADAPPLPMGCADCGHAPYAHGCPGRAADHEYAQPSAELMDVRLQARRLGVPLPAFVSSVDQAPAEVISPMPARGRPEPPVPVVPEAPTPPRRTPRPVRPATRPAATAPPRRDEVRRPVSRRVEPREDRAARLALARDPRSRRRARVAARAHAHDAPPPSTGPRSATWPPLTLLDHRTLRPGPAVASGQGYPLDVPASRRHQPHRWEVAA